MFCVKSSALLKLALVIVSSNLEKFESYFGETP